MTHNTETGVLNCLISVGMTPVLQDPKSRQDCRASWQGKWKTPDFVDWGNLYGENDILERHVPNQSGSYIGARYSEHPQLLSGWHPVLKESIHGAMGHLYRKNRANTYKIRNPKYIPIRSLKLKWIWTCLFYQLEKGVSHFIVVFPTIWRWKSAIIKLRFK